MGNRFNQSVLLGVQEKLVPPPPDPSPARYIYQEFPALIAHLKKNDKLPCIVFSFNREYCNGLTKLMMNDYEKKIDDARISEKYAEKQKAKEKEEAAN